MYIYILINLNVCKTKTVIVISYKILLEPYTSYYLLACGNLQPEVNQ